MAVTVTLFPMILGHCSSRVLFMQSCEFGCVLWHAETAMSCRNVCPALLKHVGVFIGLLHTHVIEHT
jgi:hypothetical protein